MRFLPEPAGLEALLAFAEMSELHVITFDQAFRRLAGERAVTPPPDDRL